MAPATWADYQTCRAFVDANPEYGLGLILGGRNDDRLIGFDFDDIEKIAPGHRDASNAWRKHILGMIPSYAELSPSKTGVHLICRGILPNNATAFNALKVKLGIEIYAAKRYFTMTGDALRFGGRPLEFVNCQMQINTLIAEIEKATGTTCGDDFDTVDETQESGRRLDLTDEQVLDVARKANRKFGDWADAAWPPGIWSDINVQVLGDLDKVTGDPDQILRIARSLPYVVKSPPATNRETREHKLWRRIAKDLQKLRPDNDRIFAVRDAERQRVLAERPRLDAILQASCELTREVRRKEAIAHAVTARDLEHDVDASDPIARLHFLLDDAVPGNYDDLTIPPGAVGEFVHALGTMLTGPRLTYALPAVIATLSGYLGQTFKTPGFEMGLVNHFIIAGQMNTGKTTSLSVFERAVDQALDGWYRNPHKPTALMPTPTSDFLPAKRRMINTRAMSVQGLFERLSTLGCAMWFADEAESQIELMSSGQPLGVALKAFYKQTFDQSTALASTALDLSRENSKMGIPDILNMTLPTYFSCTSEVFEKIGTKELVDGTYSRVNMIYDEEPMPAVVEDAMNLHKGLPLPLAQLMQKIALIADDTASAYDQDGLAAKLRETLGGKNATATKEDYRKLVTTNKRAGAEKCVVMSLSSDAKALNSRIGAICRQLGHEANPHIGKWPVHYQVLARSDMLPMLIAGVLACCDTLYNWKIELPPSSPDWRKTMPQVTIEAWHMQWAFEFVMHWRMRFFKAWDQGKIAVRMSDDEVVMERMIIRALASKEGVTIEGTRWAPKWHVVKLAKGVAPFKGADDAGRALGRAGSTEMAHRTLERMVKNGLVLEHVLKGEKSKPTTLISLVKRN